MVSMERRMINRKNPMYRPLQAVAQFKLAFLFLCYLTIVSCATKTKYVETMPALVLENGMQVNTCHDYEQMRSVFVLQDTPANKMVSAQYLVCSLAIGLSPDLFIDITMRAIFHGLKIDQLPLSISGRRANQLSLSSAGFQLWLEKSMLSLDNPQHAIQIQYKGMLKNGNHLIWVSDVAPSGNYAAFYPAIVIIQDGRVLGTAPVYASGY